MNVLLVYPEFPDTFWSLKHALRFVRKKAFSPPLGLLTVAAMLPGEWGKRLVDVNVTPLCERDLAWADYAFVSGMAVQGQSARQVIARCKAAGVKVVAGGPLFSSESERFAEVDHFILNEAELTLPPFLADLGAGRAGRVYATSELADLRRTPVPSWELLAPKEYLCMSVQFSRGCPYDCEFCNVTSLFGHRPRTKTAQQIVAELDGLWTGGWRGSVFFVDDNLIGNRKAAREELLPALIGWQRGKGGISFLTQATINLADDETLVRRMVEAGFDTVFVGIETPEAAGLRECQKRHNQGRDLVSDVKRLQRAGLQVQAGFIVGFDSDTPSVFQRQIDFIQQSGIVTAMVGLLQAFGGTRLYERLRREGRLLGEPTGDNADGTTNIVPAMGIGVLRAGYRRILQAIYSPRQYYQRLTTFLREYRAPKMGMRLDVTRIVAFFRSLYELGVVGKERVYYWKLLLWTAVCRPRLLPLAVSLAICGHHYRTICELHGGGKAGGECRRRGGGARI